MNHYIRYYLLLVAVAFAYCCSDEPRYADPVAHEMTVKLNGQYGPLIVGTWHYENISDTQRYFERLTFQADGTLTGMRIWQTRKLVTIEGRGTERHVHGNMAAEILESRGKQRREAQLPAVDRHIRR